MNCCDTFCKKYLIISVAVIIVVGVVSAFFYTKNAERAEKLEVVPRPWDNHRLSPDVEPILYSLFLRPFLNSGVFKGKVTITIIVKSRQPQVYLHVKGLEVTKTKLTVDDEARTEVRVTQAFEHERNEFWVIIPENELNPGTYLLYIEFEGKLTNKIIGFYRSTYRNAEGSEKHLATTKFEPTFARQAFPCFDEPSFKARYDIALVRPSGDRYIALSNMNQTSEEVNKPENGFTTVKFGTSLPMSTYLACFIVCDFDHSAVVTAKQGFPITVYARRQHVEHVKYAASVAKTTVDFYVEYFQVDYPLPKLDLIAVPDFVSGAMENWGLITFRETRLLCASTGTSYAHKLAVATTVAHEIAHMWFGDLVTMKWWNDLWLNEGFATFVQYKAVAEVHKDWELDNIFIAQELYSVLKLDATLNSHPIIQPVSHPDQITEIFDDISYSKGASVIRMLESTIGTQNFKNGLGIYMNRHKYSNAETPDLWDILDECAGEINVTSFMDTWTKQMGFPLISVTLNDTSLTLIQKRFLIDPAAEYDKTESPYNYRWEIPLTYFVSGATTLSLGWMKTTDEEVKINLPSKVDWLKVNFHSLGFYIVNYELTMWEKFSNLLQTRMKTFDPADRSNLLNDAFLLAEAEEVPYDVPMKLTKYLRAEYHYTPWSVACTQFLALNKRLYGTEAYPKFEIYVTSLIKDLKVMTWEIRDSGTYPQIGSQSLILNLGCTIGHSYCLNQASTLFKQWLQVTAMGLNPEVVEIVMYFGIERTGKQEWEKLWDLHVRENNPQTKIKMMKALCGTRDPKLIKKYLQLAKNETFVRSQDYLTLISTLSRNPIASPHVWEFIRNEWDFLVKRYTLNDRYLGNTVAEVCSNFATENRLLEMKEFFSKHPEAGAGAAARKRALERVENNVKWRSKHVDELEEWLREATRTETE